MKEAKIKISETVIIKRTEINFAPYNPRKDDERVVNELKKNFKKVGYLGGIQWNPLTGNIIGGHKRVQALDSIYGYPEKVSDYALKVEKFELSLKEEMSQNIFLNNKRKQGVDDYEKLALILPEIDMDIAGIGEYEVKLIESIVPSFEQGNIEDTMSDLDAITSKKEAQPFVKDLKEKMRGEKNESKRSFYFAVTFQSYTEKAEFLEGIGINGDETFLNSDEFVTKLEENGIQ